MYVPKRTQYALRGVFELAKRGGQGPVKIGAIAEAQAIPTRFLEVILNQLKQQGLVGSKRGKAGGYFLIQPPEKLTVGDVMRSLQGPFRAVRCSPDGAEDDCPFYGNCVFLPMWERVQQAVSDIYDQTTFQTLVDQEAENRDGHVPSYSI